MRQLEANALEIEVSMKIFLIQFNYIKYHTYDFLNIQMIIWSFLIYVMMWDYKLMGLPYSFC